MLLVLVQACLSVPIRFGSVVQLKNVYSKNRLGVTTVAEAYHSPDLFSSRPPFDDGWTWSVLPAQGSPEDARDLVRCGSSVVFQNPVSSLYISSLGKETVRPSASNGTPWLINCSTGDHWAPKEKIFLYNPAGSCYLQTILASPFPPESPNKWEVWCGELNPDAVWIASEGFYLYEEPSVD